MTAAMIPFNKPHMTGRELAYIAQAHGLGHLAGNGEFTRRCHAWLEAQTGCGRALLTHSCTAALEMGALLLDLQPGDEVIMPSYTFVSTANAFVLRGAVPVFVDIRPDTLNLDETQIEAAITPRTRAIVAVHYAGVGCEMDAILALAQRHGLRVIEDAAQALGARYRGRPLGSLGDAAALSFHETKNIIAGEGGALLVNAPEWSDRAEVMREKGTNRAQFFRGQVDKYTWVDVGSSFLPSELIAAFLLAQFEAAQAITAARLALWQRYHEAFAESEKQGPGTPPGAARALRAQRPYVLPAAAGSGAPLCPHRGAEGARRAGGVPLRAPAQCAGRAALCPCCGRPAGHRRHERAAIAPAHVVGTGA